MDPGSDFRLFFVSGGKHFEAGVDVVDEVEESGLRGFGFDRGSILELAMMGSDQVEEVQADVLRGGCERFPFLDREFSPKGIDEFDSDGDVAEEFAPDFARHLKAQLRWAHFPELSRIVEQNPGKKEIPIQVGIDPAQGGCGAHHLRGMPEQSAAVCVVVETRRRRPLESFAVLRKKNLTQGFEPRVGHRANNFAEAGEIPFSSSSLFGCSLEEFLRLFRFERTHAPPPPVETERAVDQKLAFDLHTGAAVCLLARIECRSIGPCAQGEGIGGIPQLELPERLSVGGFLLGDLVHLAADPAVQRAGPAILSQLGNRAARHLWHVAENGVLLGGLSSPACRSGNPYQSRTSAGFCAMLPGMPSLRLGIFGASGFVGSTLCGLALRGGDEVVCFSRSERPGFRVFRGAGDLAGLDAVVNLAGEPVLGIWTAARKQKILESRVRGTGRIVDAITSGGSTVRTLVNASAIGFYGDTGERVVDEASPRGSGFLAETCESWEAAASGAVLSGVRVVLLRIGFVIGSGGAMGLIRPVFRMGLGGRLGSGRQWMSCIHVEDVAGMILWAIHQDAVSGPVNSVMPEPVTNAEFTRAVAASVRRPAIFPVPGFALKLALGELSHVLLDSSRVSPGVARSCGYPYRFSTLPEALQAS